jgi:hypothetical protein
MGVVLGLRPQPTVRQRFRLNQRRRREDKLRGQDVDQNEFSELAHFGLFRFRASFSDSDPASAGSAGGRVDTRRLTSQSSRAQPVSELNGPSGDLRRTVPAIVAEPRNNSLLRP